MRFALKVATRGAGSILLLTAGALTVFGIIMLVSIYTTPAADPGAWERNAYTFAFGVYALLFAAPIALAGWRLFHSISGRALRVLVGLYLGTWLVLLAPIWAAWLDYRLWTR